jgi:hypothetical protein
LWPKVLPPPIDDADDFDDDEEFEASYLFAAWEAA